MLVWSAEHRSFMSIYQLFPFCKVHKLAYFAHCFLFCFLFLTSNLLILVLNLYILTTFPSYLWLPHVPCVMKFVHLNADTFPKFYISLKIQTVYIIFGVYIFMYVMNYHVFSSTFSDSYIYLFSSQKKQLWYNVFTQIYLLLFVIPCLNFLTSVTTSWYLLVK